MKYYSTIICLLLVLQGKCQSHQPDYCHFMKEIFSNNRCLKYLRIDTNDVGKIVIVDNNNFLKCHNVQLSNKRGTLIILTDSPKIYQKWFQLNNIQIKDNTYDVLIIDPHRHITVRGVFMLKKNKWLLDYYGLGEL